MTPPRSSSRAQPQQPAPRKKAPFRAHRLLVTALLCLSAIPVGCGNGDEEGRPQRQAAKDAPNTERLVACLRDSGATVKEIAPPRHPGAEDKRLHATFRSGYTGVFLIYRSSAATDRRYTALGAGQASALVRKGSILLTYSGSTANATALEDCLRQSGEGGEPPRGELARQLRRIEAKEEANTRRYRNRQYNTPEEIGDALERLRGYRRYRLYHLGRRYSTLPLTAVLSRLQPPAYQQSYKPPQQPPPPSSPTFDFIYGSCEPPPGSDEGGCAAPLDIQNYEICAHNPHSYGTPPRAVTQRVRGAPVLQNQGAGAFEIYTGSTTIVIYANDWRATTRAARQLRSLDGSIGPNSPLPPPVPGALEGRLRCRPAP